MKRRLAFLLAAVLLLGGCASLPEADELEEEWEDYQQFPRQEADEEEKPAEPDHIMTKWGVGYYFKE